MAPATPHRFLAGQRRQPSPSKETKRTPVPRWPVPQPTEYAVPPDDGVPSQFAATPRFSAGRAKPATPRSPSRPALVDALRITARLGEEVEDAAASSDDDEMLDSEQIDALPTTEGYGAGAPDWVADLPHSPKRRKVGNLDSDEHDAAALSSPARPTFKPPQTPASAFRHNMSRFSHPPASISSTMDEAVTGQHRPPFMRSSIAPAEPTEPVPEVFSPHRRGQKFVPGGMAATVQQWVIEAGQSAVQSRRGQAYLRGDDFALKVKLMEVKGEGPYVARARTGDGEDVHVLLTASVSAQGDHAADVIPGSVVGIRAPTWDSNVGGRMWRVGVDWKVLHGT